MAKVDAFRILTNYYNNHLNKFIAQHSTSKEINRYYTGGLHDIVEQEHDPYFLLALELEKMRGEIFSYTQQFEKLNKNQVKKIGELILGYYQQVSNINELETELLIPLRKMFIELDAGVGTNFKEKIEKIHSERVFQKPLLVVPKLSILKKIICIIKNNTLEMEKKLNEETKLMNEIIKKENEKRIKNEIKKIWKL